MQIQHHIAKISWILADKVLFVIYGFVFLIQISLLTTEDVALFGFLIAFNTWIFVISDSFALQPIIQYGFSAENRGKVNTYSLVLHLLIVVSFTFMIKFYDSIIADYLSEPRFLEITIFLPILSLLMIPRTYCLKLMLRDLKMNKIFLTNFVFFGVMVVRIVGFKLIQSTISLEDAIYIYLQGAGASSLIAIILTIRQLRFSLKGNISYKNIMSFSLPFTITNAINTIPKYLDIVILKLFFPLEQIGIYSAAKSLFKFFEEGMHGVNGLVYPAAVRSVTNNDSAGLQSIVSKAVSFTLLGFLFGSLILTFGFADFLITHLMKAEFISAILHFKLLLIATLFLPFNILYFIITASGRHFDLMRIVTYSFIITVMSFVMIGLVGESTLMPLGYVTYYMSFSILAFRYVNDNNIVILKFRDLFRAIYDSRKFVEKLLKKG